MFGFISRFFALKFLRSGEIEDGRAYRDITEIPVMDDDNLPPDGDDSVHHNPSEG